MPMVGNHMGNSCGGQKNSPSRNLSFPVEHAASWFGSIDVFHSFWDHSNLASSCSQGKTHCLRAFHQALEAIVEAGSSRLGEKLDAPAPMTITADIPPHGRCSRESVQGLWGGCSSTLCEPQDSQVEVKVNALTAAERHRLWI